jgi:hypothetical protein
MRNDNCRQWRELLGAYLLGQLEPKEKAELESHLEGCSECRAEEAELRSVAELLGETGSRPGLEEGLDPPPELKEKVVERTLGRPRHVPPAVASAAAALLVVVIGAAALFVGLPNSDGPPGLGDEEPVSFGSPPQGITIETSVVAHTWGTELLMEAEGFETGEVYTVSIEREDGTSVPTGTFIGVGEEEIDCALNAAVLRQNATAVVITDSDGDQVLRSNLERRSPSLYT